MRKLEWNLLIMMMVVMNINIIVRILKADNKDMIFRQT